MRPHGTGIGLGMLAALLVFFAVLVILGIRTEQARPSITTTIHGTVLTTTSVTRPTPSITSNPVGPVSLQPATVVVSSELSAEYGAERLFDGDASTAWRDASLHGDGTVITLNFERPVTIFAVVIRGLEDDSEFHRSFRIRRFHLDPGKDGLPQEVEMPDAPEAFRVDLGGVAAEVVTIEVISTYTAEPDEVGPATDELAVAEIEILGEAPD
jgi:hypothetical protein